MVKERHIGVDAFKFEGYIIIRPKTGWRERPGINRNEVTLTREQAKELLPKLVEILRED